MPVEIPLRINGLVYPDVMQRVNPSFPETIMARFNETSSVSRLIPDFLSGELKANRGSKRIRRARGSRRRCFQCNGKHGFGGQCRGSVLELGRSIFNFKPVRILTK